MGDELERFDRIFGGVQKDAGVLHWVTDHARNKVLFVNGFCEDIWELKREEIYEDRFAMLGRLHPDERERVRAQILALDDGQDFDEIVRLALPSGRQRWVHVRARTIDEAHAGPSLLACVAVDVTAKHVSNTRLTVQRDVSHLLSAGNLDRETAKQLLAMIAAPLDWVAAGLWIVSSDQTHLRCSAQWHHPAHDLAAFDEATCRLSLVRGESIPGRAWETAAPVRWDLSDAPAYMRRAAAERAGLGQAWAFPILHGGAVVGVLDFAGFGGMIVDAALCDVVSALSCQIGAFLEGQRLREESIRETEHLRIISASLTKLLMTDSFQQCADELLSGALKVTGSSGGFFGAVIEGQGLHVLASCGIDPATLEGREVGAPGPLASLTTLIDVPIRAGDEVIGELAVTGPQDGPTEWARSRLQFLGELAGVVCLRFRSQQESASMANQLLQSQKMEAIGRLAGGVAHDFNNLLQIIAGYSEMLVPCVKDDAFGRDAVERVRRAADRARGLTRQLLAFSRKEVHQTRVVDLGGLITEAQTMFLRLIGEDIEVVNTTRLELWPVMVDPGRIEQVLMNLLVNARDAMPRGGRISIETANASFDGTSPQVSKSVPPGKWVRLSVTDSGVGMSPEVQSKVFEPFFTTKGPDRGTGLGLSTVYGIVKQSGGHVRVYSEPGKGTSFHVFLPAALGKEQAAELPEEAAPLAPGFATVLVVEDQEDIRTVVATMLTQQGYTVLVALDVQDALRIAQTHAGTIDLVVSDVVMPSMNGPAVVEEIRRTRPDIAVLFMSGYTDHPSLSNDELEPGVPVLHKPFDRTTLLAAVGNSLAIRAKATPVEASRPPEEAPHIAALQEELGWHGALRIVQLFLSDLDSKCKVISATVERGDFEMTIQAAHAMRGAATKLGAQRLARICQDLETLAHRSDLSGARVCVAALLAEAARVREVATAACGV